MRERSAAPFRDGIHDGMPIGVGYLSVSIGFGIMAVAQGMPMLAATLMSAVNMTSAGQVAGLSVIMTGGTLAELALCQIVINLRYSLMSITLSQRLGEDVGLWRRMLIGAFITDEVFAVSTSRAQVVGFPYMMGLVLPCIVGWTGGTAIGALAGNILPLLLRNALGIAIYGMFVAIVMPPAHRYKSILGAVLLAAALSCCFRYLPFLAGVGSGFAIILSGLAAAALFAWLRPFSEKKEAAKQ